MEQNENTTAPANTAVQESAHLLDTQAQPEAPVDTVPSTEELAQGQIKPAQDTRPGWLPEKFKTPEDLAKSYSELEKKMTTKVPEKYDWGFAKDFGLDEITADLDKELNLSQAFKSAGLNQDQARQMLALYSDQLQKIQGQIQTAPVVDIQAESQNLKKVWGNDYQTRLEAVRKFSTTIPERALTMPLIDTAEGIQFLETLMEGNRMPNPITNTQSAPSQDINSVRENIREMRADAKFKLPPGDPVGETHRQRLYSLYEQLDRLEKQGR